MHTCVEVFCYIEIMSVSQPIAHCNLQWLIVAEITASDWLFFLGSLIRKLNHQFEILEQFDFLR